MKRLLYSSLLCMLLAGCAVNNVTIDDTLEKHFTENKVTGCFGLYDNGLGRFTLYNRSRFKDSVYLPASTFKIVNSLIGLETGRVADTNAIIKWDGVTRSRPEWNQDLRMADAFRFSSVPWFQELARRIGKDTMQHYLDTLGYAAKRGRAVIRSVDTFWLNNNIRITADEQLGLAKKLYFDQLPFYSRTQDMVKGMMLMENTTAYKLSYKTGWGQTPAGSELGWVVGWIEENKHPYFFVLQIESKDHNIDLGKVRLSMLHNILRQLGFLEGKR
jgi:beta-lactamase class D